MPKIVLIIALSIFALTSVFGQAPVFSQFYTSGLYLNPALAGMEDDVVLAMNYRSQWAGVNLPFRTFQFSAIHPIIQHGVKSKHLGGFGATLFSDEAGPNREVVSQGFSIASSYNFQLSPSGNHLIAAALQFGVIQKQINLDVLQWSSQYSPVSGYDATLPGEHFASESVTSPVINAGMVWRLVLDTPFKPLRMFYNGFAVSNINRPKGFFLDRRDAPALLYKVHGGYVYALNRTFEVSPNYLIQYQESSQINIGGYGAYNLPATASKAITELKLSIGFWYRIDDSFIVTTGLSTPSWNAGFSYDANTSALEKNFNGANAFEFSFAYRINIRKDVKKFATPMI